MTRFMRHVIVGKSIRVAPEEFARFRADYVANRNWHKNALFFSAWVSSKESDGSVKVIVADRKPPERISREKQEDELLPESRRDTFWGDVKVVAKTLSRDAAHQMNQAKQQEEFSGPTSEARIAGLSADQVMMLRVGDQYTFEIGSRPESWSLALVALSFFGKRVLTNFNEPTVRFSDWLADRSRVFRERAAFAIVTILSLIIWAGSSGSGSGRPTTTMAASATNPLEREAGRNDKLPPELARQFEGCPPNTEATYKFDDGAYSAFCIEPGYGATGARVRWWADTGKKFREETWFRGKMTGAAKSWDHAGRLLAVELFGTKGLMDGETTVYDYDERQLIVQQWKDGKMIRQSKKALTKANAPK